ncbi:MAG: tRNA modification GTPase, partial [Gammaproteobacteria bacterium]
MHASPDTISAIATAHGRGGVGIVRVSGARARLIAQHILGRIPAPRRVARSTFNDTDGTAIDDGISVWF